MNLDLLKKLVRLANNNPNENEANSAARRVCKLIEENEFKFIENKQQAPRVGQPQGVGVYEDILEFIRKSQQQDTQKAQAQYRESRFYDQQTNWYDTSHHYSDAFHYARSQQQQNYKSAKRMKCSKCGKVNDTGFVGPEFAYICNECTWGPK